MADHQQGPVPGRPAPQLVGEPVHRLDVQVVGRLVQHQQVMVGQQELGQPGPPRSPPLSRLTRASRSIPGQQVLDHGPGVGLRGPDMVAAAPPTIASGPWPIVSASSAWRR